MAVKGALAFQHQHKLRGVAAHAVRRAAKQLLHVTNADICRGFKKEQAAAIAFAAPNRHFDRRCGGGGGGGWLHSSGLISKSARAIERIDTTE